MRSHLRSPCRIAVSQGFAALLAAIVLLQASRSGNAQAAPTGTISSPAPSLHRGAPKAAEIADGDSAVSGNTGNMTYDYPIEVPPGRNGMAPELSLTYSSQAPVYGTVAAGWALSIPHILEDTSEGRLPETEATPPGVDPRSNDRFISTMAGRRALIPVVEPTQSALVYKTYRAQGDSAFMRYERMESLPDSGYRWRVRATSGTVMYFGQASSSDSRMSGACLSLRSDGYAPLTGVVDAFGNEVAYYWGDGAHGAQGIPECVIQKITWGQNLNSSAGVAQPFAQTVFNWEPSSVCNGVPVGSYTSFRTGQKIVSGASKLASIVSTAFQPGAVNAPEFTRQVTLAYDAQRGACNVTSHSPVRLLGSIQDSAWGVDSPRVDLPAITFEYGNPAVNLSVVQPAGHGPLAQGVRYRSNVDDRWPTIEKMHIDIDGDGRLDELWNSSTPSTDGQCSATWYKSRGGPPRHIPLPRLKWHGSHAQPGSDPSGGATTLASATWREGCSLNGQTTVFKNSNSSGGCHVAGSTCAVAADPQNPSLYCTAPGVGTRCPVQVPEPPLTGEFSPDFATYLIYRWLDIDGDGLVDLVAAAHGNIKWYDIEQGNLPGFGPEPDRFGPWPACPTAMDRSPGDWPLETRSAYERCHGLYPWFIYKNLGNGQFAGLTDGGSPAVKYSPIPLEPDIGDSSIKASTTHAHQALIDFDGDGRLDAVFVSYATGQWYVWRGDGTGGFHPQRYSFASRSAPAAQTSIGSTVIDVDNVQRATCGLFDVHSDGLPEHWIALDPQGAKNANLAINDSASFRLPNGTGEINTSQDVRPGSDRLAWLIQPQSIPPIGFTKATNRTIDVDQDGRIDVVWLSHWGSAADESAAVVYYNVGGQFQPFAVPYPGDVRGISNQNEGKDDRTWQLNSDILDLDGDGIAEGVTATSVASHDLSSGPPRLLVSIDNGRGAKSEIAYASMHDPAVVEQHPEDTWFDGRPKASPRTQWVVRQIKVLERFPAQESRTEYFYKNPRYGADDRGHYAFRGFEEVTTTEESGSKSIEYYGYDVDWSGRLVKTVTKADDGQIHTIEKARWEERQLFGGLLKTYHAAETEDFVCANGQVEDTCTAWTAPGYTRTLTTLAAVSSTTSPDVPLLWQPVQSIVQSGHSSSNGDRRTRHSYHLHADAFNYLLRPNELVREVLQDGDWDLFGKSRVTWDPSYRFKQTDEVWFDANDAERAITRYVYHDDGTGNLKHRIKPEQYASGAKTTYGYDSRLLFVATEVNEVGHQLDFSYEYGTGTKILTSGPNTRTCTTNCPQSNPIYPVKQQNKLRVDGLGRAIERWDTFSDDGSVYVLYQVATTSYVDAATGTVPSSVTNRTRLESSPSSIWREERTESDGQGRPIRTIVLAQGSAPNDHVTTFAYRSDGTLKSVSVPDPTTNNASTVTYTYDFDSLGRPTSFRRPDAGLPADQSGVDMAYDGATRTATEVLPAGAGGGQPAATRTISDSFDRVVEVHERIDTSLPWAITRYTYGPDDNVETIVDPEGAITSLKHDFAGHRIEVSRHGRSWRYTYDKNGNADSELVPGSPSPPTTDVDYTTTIVYDDLDRPLSKLVGRRSLSAADQSLFAANAESFTWDYGPNRKGYLRYWQTYAPNSSAAAITVDLANNSQGQRTTATHSFGIAGYPTMSRQVYQFYYLFGGVRASSYHDYVGGIGSTSRTTSETYYDARFLPQSMRVYRTGELTQTLAEQTRNVAGLVTKRRTNTTGAMTFVESNWTYDKMGRVVDQMVQKGPGSTQVARQSFSYLGNDAPKTLAHYLGVSSNLFNFGYDHRNQLTSVSSATPGYYDANYEYSESGRFKRASEAQTIHPLPPGTKVHARDVDYVYGDVDPERVTAIVNRSDATTYAGYSYDPAGNQTRRCYGGTGVPTCVGESTEYVYDGKDQLRRATKKVNGVIQGSEEYWYDGEGARVAIVKRDAAGAKTEMIWFIGDVQAHYDEAGAVTQVYSHLSLGTPVARVHRFSDTSSTLEYQFHGMAHSTIAAVAHDGTINANISYSPFGEVLEASGTVDGLSALTRRFNDKYSDDLSNLAYYGARYYDRTLLGWTQADPLYLRGPDAAGVPRRANLYQFVLNNPLSNFDPDGLRDQKVAAPGAFDGIQGPVRPYRSEAETFARLRNANEVGEAWEVDTNSCAYNSNRCSFILGQGPAGGGDWEPAIEIGDGGLDLGAAEWAQRAPPRAPPRVGGGRGGQRGGGWRVPGSRGRPRGGYGRPATQRGQRQTSMGTPSSGRGSRSVSYHHHHIFPVQHREWFAQRGINIDAYTVRVGGVRHLNNIHGRGGWNPTWSRWIEVHPGASTQATINQALRMMRDYGLYNMPIVPYPR